MDDSDRFRCCLCKISINKINWKKLRLHSRKFHQASSGNSVISTSFRVIKSKRQNVRLRYRSHVR